jgi:hypothetical protein
VADCYEKLSAALALDGICGQLLSPTQLVVSRQVGPVWPNRGNSFWVTSVKERWYLFTWAPLGYCLPESGDVVALCRACVDYGISAMARVPPEIMQEFGLIELSEDEAEAVNRDV